MDLLSSHPEQPLRDLPTRFKSEKWGFHIDVGPGRGGVGFAFEYVNGRGLRPAIYIDSSYINNPAYSVRQNQFALLHEFYHYLDFLEQLEAGTVHFEDWVAGVGDAAYTVETARRHFEGEVRTYTRGARWAQQHGWVDTHEANQSYQAGGVPALARGLADVLIRIKRYDVVREEGGKRYLYSIDPVTVRSWAAAYR